MSDRKAIDEVRKAIYPDALSSDQIIQYQQLIEKYTMTSPVLLGCTELSVFHNQHRNPNVFDMAEIHIAAAKKFVTEK